MMGIPFVQVSAMKYLFLVIIRMCRSLPPAGRLRLHIMLSILKMSDLSDLKIKTSHPIWPDVEGPKPKSELLCRANRLKKFCAFLYIYVCSVLKMSIQMNRFLKLE